MTPTWRIVVGDCRERLCELDPGSVQTCVTSPPYFGLRDYGADGQIGLEASPSEYVAELVAVFRDVRRVLADGGTLWLNLGDSYAGSWGAQSRGGPPSESSTLRGNGHVGGGPKAKSLSTVQIAAHPKSTHTGSVPKGADYKPKDLLMIPAQAALALRADGWYLRSHIIWAKPNPMPESIVDRPTSSHESLFLLSKSPRYFYDADAIREEFADDRQGADGSLLTRERNVGGRTDGYTTPNGWVPPDGRTGRNRRNVWTIPTALYADAHFATFPLKLVEPCVLAGSREGDVVLDPFAGAGTTGMVALRRGRSFVGIELSDTYAAMARQRIVDDAPLLNSHAEVDAPIGDVA